MFVRISNAKAHSNLWFYGNCIVNCVCTHILRKANFSSGLLKVVVTCLFLKLFEVKYLKT